VRDLDQGVARLDLVALDEVGAVLDLGRGRVAGQQRAVVEHELGIDGRLLGLRLGVDGVGQGERAERHLIAVEVAVDRPGDDVGVDGLVGVDAVFGVATTAVERARAGEGPSLVEALTYRHGGHSRADPGKYRPDDEVAAWKARDPIPSYRARLEVAGVDGATRP
jgi:hypothetical protein